MQIALAENYLAFQISLLFTAYVIAKELD